MARKVYDNAMTAHVWAQQNQDEGRSNNGNFYFEGPTLYSYGTHYPVGIFAGVGGPVFLNSSKSTPTTEGKHKNAARRAVRHLDCFYLPELDEIRDAILAARRDERTRVPGYLSAVVPAYLNKHWRAIPADSEGAAWLLKAIGSRATWAAMRARYSSAADAKAAKEKARDKAAAIAEGRELAARPWPLIRADAWKSAADYGQRGLRETIKDCRASRLATPKAHKRVRAALWRIETGLRGVLARAEALSDRWGNPGDRLRAHAALGRLRRLKSGAIGYVPGYDGPDGPDKLAAALALPTGAGWRALADILLETVPRVHMSPATRRAVVALHEKAEAIATEREGEEKARRDIAEARRAVREGLQTFNRNRRAYRSHKADIAERLAANTVTQYNADRALGRSLDSILHYVPSATPWNADRGLALAPALASRAARIAERAEAIAAAFGPEREALRTAEEREAERQRIAARAERERIAAMTDAERREAWEAGELGREHVRALETVSGPLLRAIAPEIDGCAVKGGTLETSQGATVPLRHAFRVFQFIALCRAEGKAWKPGGTWGPRALRVGHFTVDSVAPSGDFVAGCHSIKWGEVSRLASRLGVADCLATLPELMEPEAA